MHDYKIFFLQCLRLFITVSIFIDQTVAQNQSFKAEGSVGSRLKITGRVIK